MKSKNNMNLIKLYVTKSEIEAELIKHVLERENIPCQVLNVNNSKLLPELPPNVCGVEIWIPNLYKTKAISALKTLRKAEKRSENYF